MLRVQRDRIADDQVMLRVQRDRIADDQLVLRVQRDRIADDRPVLRVQRDQIADDQVMLRVQRDRIADDQLVLRVQAACCPHPPCPLLPQGEKGERRNKAQCAAVRLPSSAQGEGLGVRAIRRLMGDG
jgi:hypothetical protein